MYWINGIYVSDFARERADCNRRYKRPIEINGIYVTVTIFTKERKKKKERESQPRLNVVQYFPNERPSFGKHKVPTAVSLLINMRGFARRARRRPVYGPPSLRAAPRFLPGRPCGRITSLISFFNSRTLKNKRVAFGAGWSRARSIKAPAL